MEQGPGASHSLYVPECGVCACSFRVAPCRVHQRSVRVCISLAGTPPLLSMACCAVTYHHHHHTPAGAAPMEARRHHRNQLCCRTHTHTPHAPPSRYRSRCLESLHVRRFAKQTGIRAQANHTQSPRLNKQPHNSSQVAAGVADQCPGTHVDANQQDLPNSALLFNTIITAQG